jgi:ribose transport system permease protein
MTPRARPSIVRILDATPFLLLALVLLGFGASGDRVLTLENLRQVLAQAAPLAIVGTGMTFVLLTGGVDLSVGAVMFVGAGLAGTLAVQGHSIWLAALVMLGTGVLGGLVNALLVTRLRLVAFIATLATLYIGRGAGRWITETRAINLPDSFLALGAADWLGVPIAVWTAAVVAGLGEFVLARTPFGRHLYAVGVSPVGARVAGLPVDRIRAWAYVACGATAGLGGLVALAQLGAVSPRFGELSEFDAITAAVLGGTSLFGGRGRVVPGTVLGALLLRVIFAGLVAAQADPYLYPLVTAAIIFAAVLLDGLRQQLEERLGRRVIRREAAE